MSRYGFRKPTVKSLTRTRTPRSKKVQPVRAAQHQRLQELTFRSAVATDPIERHNIKLAIRDLRSRLKEPASVIVVTRKPRKKRTRK